MTILFLLSVCFNIILCICCYRLAKELQMANKIIEAAKEVLKDDK